MWVSPAASGGVRTRLGEHTSGEKTRAFHRSLKGVDDLIGHGLTPEGTERREVTGNEAHAHLDSLPIEEDKINALKELAGNTLDCCCAGLEIAVFDGVEVLCNRVVETGDKSTVCLLAWNTFMIRARRPKKTLRQTI